MHRLAAAAVTMILLAGTPPVVAQSRLGCDVASADRYDALAKASRTYLDALGPNVNIGNYPGDMREEAATFSQERIDLYRSLESFITATEDFAYAIRRCARE